MDHNKTLLKTVFSRRGLTAIFSVVLLASFFYWNSTSNVPTAMNETHIAAVHAQQEDHPTVEESNNIIGYTVQAYKTVKGWVHHAAEVLEAL